MSDRRRSRRAGARPASGPEADSSPPASRGNAARRRLVAGLFVAAILAPIPAWVRDGGERVRSIRSYARCDLEEARARAWGADWTRRVAEIRAALPEDAWWRAVEGRADSGSALWLRFDLAPRRARLAGRLEGGRFAPAGDERIAGAAAAFLTGADGAAPVAVDLESLARRVPRRPVGREEPQLPGWLDDPPENARVAGPVEARGWCQERGGYPCATVRLYVDGVPVEPGLVVRFPRPDVEAAVPGIGPCGRAGWRVRVEVPSGEHDLVVDLVTEDGRWRRVPARRIAVTS